MMQNASDTITRLLRLVRLMDEYGVAKFEDEWWPGCPQAWIGDEEGQELVELMDFRADLEMGAKANEVPYCHDPACCCRAGRA